MALPPLFHSLDTSADLEQPPKPPHYSGTIAMDVAGWLRSLGLGWYEQAFRDNEIDAEVLASLTAEDLKDLGVAVVGHRRKLMDAIALLRAVSASWEGPAGPATPSSAQTERGGPEVPTS